MKALRYSVPGLLATTLLLSSGLAHAHFKLLSPDSWVKEDGSGAPQKGGPCGPGGQDDVQPVPMSMKVTEVHAGDTIMVAVDETIHHPGWFRISLAADPMDFKDPDFPNANCTVDMSTVPTTPHGNVLVDGMAMDDNLAGANRQLMQMVTLPETPCEDCTLQIIQVMADQIHSPPGCVYHHCAKLKILAKDGATAAAGSSGGAGTVAAAAGSSATAGTKAAAGGSGGSTAATSGTAGVAAPAGAKPTAAAGSGATASTSTSSATGSAGKPAPSTGTAPSTTAKAGSAAPATGSTSSPSMSSDSATGATAAKSSGGCAVSAAGADANAASFALLSVLGLFLAGRRKRQA